MVYPHKLPIVDTYSELLKLCYEQDPIRITKLLTPKLQDLYPLMGIHYIIKLIEEFEGNTIYIPKNKAPWFIREMLIDQNKDDYTREGLAELLNIDKKTVIEYIKTNKGIK